MMHKNPGMPPRSLPSQIPHSNAGIIGLNAPTLRVYQAWKGNNVFCCGGRTIFGPDVRSLFLTVSLILAPVFLFCAFVSQGLVDELHHQLGNIVVAICAFLAFFVIVFLFLTSARDPGIIPRNLHPPDENCPNMCSEWPEIQGGSSLPPTKDVMVNGMVVKVKYCQTCMLYRPPRCSHCSICNNCVERFDHHCPWVGQCIGKRNYRFFFMFVSFTTILCLYVFAFCWVNIKKIMDNYHCNLWRAFGRSPASAILIIYTSLCAWFIGGLTAFHMYLACANQTTYENFRYRYDRKTNPYNLGCPRNIMEIFFSKIPKSKNNFRDKVMLGASSVYATSFRLGHDLCPERPIGKLKAVAEEDSEDLHIQIDQVGGQEKCETQPIHGTLAQS